MSSTGQASSSSSNFQLIINALADYAKLTGIDLTKNPFAEKIELSNSPEAILELLREREGAFKEYREGNRRLISCLSPAVKVFHAFSGVLGEVASEVPFSPAKAVFTSIDVLLTTASGVTSSYDTLLELFECLGNFLQRLDIYTTIPPTTVIIDIIVKIMVEVLSVLALATKQIKQGRFKKFAKRLLGKSKVDEMDAVLQKLDRLTREEAQMNVAQTLGIVHGLEGDVRVVMEDGKTSKRDQLQRDVQHWLSPPDPSTNHDFVWKAHLTGTASWFLESDALTEWKKTGSFLWIHGKPGSGKSTLLSAIIQDIKGMCAAGLATMAYYYFDFRDVKKQDRNGLLSALLSQLSAKSDSCSEVLSQMYSNYASGTEKPTTSALTKCMKDMLSLSGKGHIYIIVDALDECPDVSGTPSAREEVLELIEELVGLKLPNLHLCVTSRPEIDIRKTLEPLEPLQISLHDESGQKDDIIEYIKSVVRSDRKMRSWRDEDKELIIKVLSEKADGMFRWVVCQFDRLRRNFPASIRSALADLPETLDRTYEQTLLGIDKEKRKYARRLFQCLSVSIRPLRVQELAEVLAIQFDATGVPLFNEDLRPLDAEEAVLSACSSLIAIVNREGGQIVQFSHFSVKEFLTSDRLATAEERLSCYHILPEPAHTLLARAGLSVLLRLDDKIDRNAINHFPLAQYAARYWVDHAHFRNVSSDLEDVMEHFFDPTKPHFAAWVWLYDIDRYWVGSMSSIHPAPPEAVPLYYAALCGFSGLVGRLLTSHSLDFNSRGGSHTTPLHAATVRGHVDVTSLLLEGGADPNSVDNLGRVPLHKISQGGHLVMEQTSFEITRLLVNSGANVNATDDVGCTPLHAAAQNGHREIAQELHASGASLDARSQRQETPLHLSCGSGKLEVSRFLIDCGSDVKSQNYKSLIPLHNASRLGHVDVARLLLDCGSDVDARDARRWTPLHYASRYGYLDLAWLLIDRGADVDAQKVNRWTAMHLASSSGHLDIVRLLIESGAAVSARDNEGWTPFHTASEFGHLFIVKFLLESGIDIDIRNNEWTALHVASGSGKLDVVRFLIEHGADIHVKDDKGWNSLHVASKNGHLDVVRMLIDASVAVDIRSGTQMTPLALASSKGKVEVARFLIERGADLNARDDRSWAPLHHASGNGYLDMAQMLLDNGAYVDAQNDDRWTPLHLASTNGHLNVVELLVRRDASVDMFNDKQETPLFRVAGNGNVAIARLLIDHGASLHTIDSNGWTPLHTASHSGHLAVVKLLLRRGAGVNVLNMANKTAPELASENGKTEVARLIAEYRADANNENKMRSTTLDTAQYGADEDGGSLHDAAEKGNLDVVKSLLQRGIDINSRNESNETPLNRAALKGNLDVIRLLVERGADVESRDGKGWTPLHIASRYGHLEVSRLLIDHGANVNARKDNHWTPTHLSAGVGDLKIVKLLVERGADVHAMNDKGETPFQLSLRYGYPEVADLLREHSMSRASP